MRASVSVLVPAYNAERWIGEALDSILGQTVPAAEVIVIDDGSIDGTPGVVRGFGARVQYVRQENAGAAAARNRGLALARGDYIAFLDADDLWLPEKLEKQLALLERQPELKWVYSDAYFFVDGRPETTSRIGRHLKLRSGNIFEALLLGDFIASPTPVIHREVFARLGQFVMQPPWLVYAEDWEMWLRIAQIYPIGLVHEPLARYRLSAGSKSQSSACANRHRVAMEIVARAIQSNPSVSKTLANHARHNLCLASAERMMGKREIPEARATIRTALRYRASVRAFAYLALAYCPLGLQRVLRRVRRAVRRIPSLA
jgi:GT2 family glycosyltransferase